MHVIGRLFALIIFMLAGQLAAQETRVGEPGFESPPATIADVDWLVGQWSGEGIGGAEAHESWLPPSGGTMVGTFVQETDEGSIRFTEHMYLMEHEGSLVVRLKHFNADLTGWEDKEGMVTFRLLAIEPCAIYFSALTYRCATPEEGEGGLVVAVRMKSDKPEPQELLFRFDPMERDGNDSRCPDAMATLDVNECYAGLLERAEARMAQYLDAALSRIEDDESQSLLVRSTQEGFMAYRGGECGGVHEQFAGGSIRPVMYLICTIELTDQRTHVIWQNWLQFMDSTPPVLPEPKPTE